MVALHATASLEVMFTTYSFTHKGHYTHDAINQARHVWESLREVGRMNNAIMITYDVHSCQVMWEDGIPCLLDQYLPQPDQLPGDLLLDVAPEKLSCLEFSLTMLQGCRHTTIGKKSSVNSSPEMECADSVYRHIAHVGVPQQSTAFLPLQTWHKPFNLHVSLRTGQYGNAVPHWYQKYAWGLKLLEWGYSPLFFETGGHTTLLQHSPASRCLLSSLTTQSSAF